MKIVQADSEPAIALRGFNLREVNDPAAFGYRQRPQNHGGNEAEQNGRETDAEAEGNDPADRE
jgi:hypothetical protein